MATFQLDVPNQIFTFEMVHQKLFHASKKCHVSGSRVVRYQILTSIHKTGLRHSQNQTTPVIQKSCYVSNTGNDTGQQQEKARIIGMPLLCQLGRVRTRWFFCPPEEKNLVETWWFGGMSCELCNFFSKTRGGCHKKQEST